jgi:hypothetical protein
MGRCPLCSLFCLLLRVKDCQNNSCPIQSSTCDCSVAGAGRVSIVIDVEVVLYPRPLVGWDSVADCDMRHLLFVAVVRQTNDFKSLWINVIGFLEHPPVVRCLITLDLFEDKVKSWVGVVAFYRLWRRGGQRRQRGWCCGGWCGGWGWCRSGGCEGLLSLRDVRHHRRKISKSAVTLLLEL